MSKKNRILERCIDLGYDPEGASKILNSILEIISEELLIEGDVSLPSLGKIKVVETKSRVVCDNIRKVRYCKGSTKKAVFQPSASFTRQLNKP